MLVQPREGMPHHRQMRCVVPGEIGGPQERHLASEHSSGGGDFGIVSGQDEPIEDAGLARRLDGICDEWLAVKQFQIFAGDALGPAARGDDAEESRRDAASHMPERPKRVTRCGQRCRNTISATTMEPSFVKCRKS